ncbi:prenyltransferase [Senegalia massiliensis]|jgi:1,4-dihydroxy-2-naphthoate octaprenyltransferase|uniref:prenyltransferase n=1 Tax=Senegalia massiliensis TaxID=1720316 RepID=UPI0010321641|nr:prenyltransferase [Senegalia massiliensis]
MIHSKTITTNINRKNIKDIWIASRPLSLTLALYSTTLGIVIAYNERFLFKSEFIAMDIWKIFLVTIAGLLIQTATNFINDFFECEYKYREQSDIKYKFLGKQRTKFDILIFLLGIGCFLITMGIGLYIMLISTPKLMIIGLIGVIGGYSYTGEPIVYKKRGLGTPLSFILMGPLMVFGSYLVFSEHFSLSPIIIGLPVSLMIPLLMMSNEIRDYKRDKSLGINTLTVRMGYRFGKILFLTLLILPYFLTTLYVLLNILPIWTLFIYLTIPLAIKSYKNVSVSKKEGVPITNKLHLIFGLITIISLII